MAMQVIRIAYTNTLYACVCDANNGGGRRCAHGAFSKYVIMITIIANVIPIISNR